MRRLGISVLPFAIRRGAVPFSFPISRDNRAGAWFANDRETASRFFPRHPKQPDWRIPARSPNADQVGANIVWPDSADGIATFRRKLRRT